MRQSFLSSLYLGVAAIFSPVLSDNAESELGCMDAVAPFLYPPCPVPGSLPVTQSATCGWRCQGYRPLAQSRSVFIVLNRHDSTASLFAFSCNEICALPYTEIPLLCMIILFLSMGEPGLKFPLDRLHLQEPCL